MSLRKHGALTKWTTGRVFKIKREPRKKKSTNKYMKKTLGRIYWSTFNRGVYWGAPLESGTFQAKRLRTGLRTSNVKAWKMVRKSAIDALGVRWEVGGRAEPRGFIEYFEWVWSRSYEYPDPALERKIVHFANFPSKTLLLFQHVITWHFSRMCYFSVINRGERKVKRLLPDGETLMFSDRSWLFDSAQLP